MLVMLQTIQQQATCPHCMSALACALFVGIPEVVGSSIAQVSEERVSLDELCCRAYSYMTAAAS
jgi:hypothetical protein